MKLIVFLLAALSPLVAAGMAYATIQCGMNWSESGLEYKFRPFKGCMVKVNGGFVPERAVSLRP